MSKDRKQLLIIGGVVLVSALVVFGVVFLLGRYFGSSPDNESNTYYDSWSKQTVSNPHDQTPETYGRAASEPIFLGTADLLDYGVSKYQLDAFKYAITQYSIQHGNSVQEVSIKVDDITPLPRKDIPKGATTALEFDIKFNRKDIYKAKLVCSNIVTAQLYLYDTKGKEVYDSGPVNLTYN